MRRDCWILAVEPRHMIGNHSKVFDWCGELEKHLSRFKFETIPNKEDDARLYNGKGTVRDSIVET